MVFETKKKTQDILAEDNFFFLKNTEVVDDGEFAETGDVGWNFYMDYYLSGRPWLFLPLTMFLLVIAYVSDSS